MKKLDKTAQAIGIFDSGIGGLTVARALVNRLPSENIIYFGDTAHLPYGDKSATTLQGYAVRIAHMLLQQPCKLILIACNSASAAAYELVKDTVGDKALVMNVIDPTIHYLQHNYAKKNIGLIGTRQTVHSNIYKMKIDKLDQGIQLISKTTNLLAAAIEEFGDHPVVERLLTEYLTPLAFDNLAALILACTHYPIIKHRIDYFFQHAVEIIDPSDIVAHAVEQKLRAKHLLNNQSQGNKRFFISDYTESFSIGAQLFFTDAIHFEHYPLWE